MELRQSMDIFSFLSQTLYTIKNKIIIGKGSSAVKVVPMKM